MVKKRIRVAIYCRVSTEEQVKFGFSIDTQKQILVEYANNNGMIIVDTYQDCGVSGSTAKRPELTRLLDDVRDKKIDMIIFTRLDRWFRSVANYYKIQELLERYHVAWQCTEEDYETVTAQGQFKVNIMLSVNQQYRDTTSEKIKESLNIKVKNGFYPSGAVPFGFKLQKVAGGSKLIHDEEKAPIIMDAINTFMANSSISATHKYIVNQYDLTMTYANFKNLLTNPLLHGEYKGYKGFCEPYISEDEHAKLMNNMKKRNVKSSTKHDYIFRGLLMCPVCGSTLKGSSHTNIQPYGRYTSYAYRCSQNKLNHKCSYNKIFFEKRLEKTVLSEVKPQMMKYLVHIETKPKQAKNDLKMKDKLTKELDRLNTMYQKGRISDEVYDMRYTETEKKIRAIVPPKEVNTSQLRQVLDMNLEEFYSTLSNAEKRIFWGSIIKRIDIDEDRNLHIIFLD